MNDMSQVIIPKSDQINADDLIAGPRTFRIEGVEIRAGTEQPVSIKLQGEERVWRPCKSMSRVLVAAWGPDANAYRGRSVTLYRDPKVKWGGMEIGGIRVSHVSHIDHEMLLQLTATKGKRAPHIVKPLGDQGGAPETDGAATWANGYIAKVKASATLDELNGFVNSKASKLAELESKRPELHRQCIEALEARRESLSPAGGFGDDFNDDTFDPEEDNPFSTEGPDDSHRGEEIATDFTGPHEPKNATRNQTWRNERGMVFYAHVLPDGGVKWYLEPQEEPQQAEEPDQSAAAQTVNDIDGPAEAEAPAWAEWLDGIKAGIGDAATKAALGKVESDYLKHYVSLPAEVVAEIEPMFMAKRKQLAQAA